MSSESRASIVAAKQAAGHCHEGRDLVDCSGSRSGGMADAADLKSAAR